MAPFLTCQDTRTMQGYLTTTEAAATMGVSAVRIRKLIADGRLPAQKVGKIYLIRWEDLACVQVRPSGWPKGRARGPQSQAHKAKMVAGRIRTKQPPTL